MDEKKNEQVEFTEVTENASTAPDAPNVETQTASMSWSDVVVAQSKRIDALESMIKSMQEQNAAKAKAETEKLKSFFTPVPKDKEKETETQQITYADVFKYN